MATYRWSNKVAYYDDYIRNRAEQAFDYDEATFALYDGDGEKQPSCLDDDLNEQMFVGAMREMIAYIFERKRDKGGASVGMFCEPENVENIYITARGLEAPTVVVEYETLPSWYSMKNADLREFYWHPKPALSGEWSAAYFQPR